MNLIVPGDRDIREITLDDAQEVELPGTFEVYPAQSDEPISGLALGNRFTGPNPIIYSTNSNYPSERVCVFHDGYFDGSNHILTLALYPVQYDPSTGRLTFLRAATIAVQLKEGQGTTPFRVQRRSGRAQKIYDVILRDLVANPQDIPAYQGRPLSITAGGGMGANLGSHKYVVVTSANLASSFNDFVAWKKRRGIDIGIVTTEEIYGSYTGDLISGIFDNAGKVRQYLFDAYQSGAVWALLAGDETVVPIRIGAEWDNCDTSITEHKIPADLYFADFNGNWNVDGDFRYGEPNNDHPDYNP